MEEDVDEVDAEGEVDPEVESKASRRSAGRAEAGDDSEARRRAKRRRTVSAPEGGGGLPSDSSDGGGAGAGRGRQSMRGSLPPHLQVEGGSRAKAGGSPLRASSLPGQQQQRKPEVIVPSSASSSLAHHSKAYHALYKTYAALHHLLMQEKVALERGERGDWTGEELGRMVARCERMRGELVDLAKVKGGRS